MNTKIIFSKDAYTKEVTTEEGFLISKKECSKEDLKTAMSQLAKSSDPNNPEALLQALRKSYQLFKVKSTEFVKKEE